MLISKTVKITWQRPTCTHYKNLGYKFTKIGDEFEVKVEHLTKGSHEKVEVLCDYCLEKGTKTIVPKEWRRYLEGREIVDKDCCGECWNKKLQESLKEQYSVSNASYIDEAKEKR